MKFSLNATNGFLGYAGSYRLKSNGCWTEQKNYKEIDDTDQIFHAYYEANEWLISNPEVEIGGVKDNTQKIAWQPGRDFRFEIVVHRTTLPENPLFTKEQLKEVLRGGDDARNNSLVIDLSGRPKLLSADCISPSSIKGVAVKFKTFMAGNRYVGKKSHLNHLDETYLTLLEGWEGHLLCGRLMYKDYREHRKTEEQYIEEINTKLSKLVKE